MRNKLKQLGDNERYQFTAHFGGVGYKAYRDKYSPTIILENVRHDGNLITDHLWFNYTKGFNQLGQLHKGDVIQFDGRVKVYTKGYYLNQTTDYKISYPSKIKLLTIDDERHVLPIVTTDKNALIGYIMQTNKAFYQSTSRPYDDWYVKQYHKWQNQQKSVKKV